MSKKHSKNSNKNPKTVRTFSLTRLFIRLFIIGCVFLAAIFIYSDAVIKEKFTENRWIVPAKIYARSLSLYHGQSISVQRILDELRLLNYQSSIKATRPGLYERYESELIVYLRGFQFSDQYEPQRKISIRINDNRITRLSIIEGKDFYLPYRIEPLLIGTANPLIKEDRTLVSLSEVPTSLIDALIISEDRDFFSHWGLSIKGIARAISQNIASGKIAQGGSTLTQQLVKNYFLNNQRSYWRKGREAIMSLILEWRYDKSEILQAYINEVYLGQEGSRAIHGFAVASQFYFGQKLSQLDLSQATTLVALVRGPSYYDPRRHPERAIKRRNLILEQLLSADKISRQELQLAQSKSLQLVQSTQKSKGPMPAAIGLVRRQLKQEYTFEQLNHDGLVVFTAIDPVIQKQAELALEQRANWLNKTRSSVPAELQGALLVSERDSGDIVAVVGDTNPDYSGFNRAIDAYRPTGSAIKPFVYLTALQRASKFNLLTTLSDRAFSLTATDGSLWQPKNYDAEEHGDVALQEALINSYNLSTARLAISVGIEQIIDTLYDSGFSRRLQAFPSLALGAQEMSPYELLRLYQLLASGGLRLDSSIIRNVLDSKGKVVERYATTAEQVVAPEPVYLVNRTLQAVVAQGTARALGQRLDDLKVAGKTGTTNDLRDSWFAGFSEQYVAVAWLGMDDNSPMGLTGSSGAMQVWADFIDRVENQPLQMVPPEGIEWAKSGWFGECLPFTAGYLPDGFSRCSE